MLKGLTARRYSAKRGSGIVLMTMLFPFVVIGFVFAYDVVSFNVAKKEATLVAQSVADAAASQFEFGPTQTLPDGTTYAETQVKPAEASIEACLMYEEALDMNQTRRFEPLNGDSCDGLNRTVGTNGTSVEVSFSYQPRGMIVLKHFLTDDAGNAKYATVTATAYRCDAAGGTTGVGLTNATTFTGNSCAAPVLIFD